MSGNLDDFERQLTGDLQRLAERAPPGPGATAVMQALRRRTARRAGAAVGGLACLFVGLMLLWPGGESTVTGPDGQFAFVDPSAGDKTKPQVAEKVEPLPVNVTSAQLENRLREYVEASHADRLVVRKNPGEPADVVMAGPALQASGQAAEMIAALFDEFDVADVEVHKGRLVRSSLLAIARPPRRFRAGLIQ